MVVCVLDAAAAAQDVASVALERVEHGAAGTVGGVGVFAGAEALDLLLGPPEVATESSF
jgi:hypothetical protein